MEAETGRPLQVMQQPKSEMSMIAQTQGWAEQNPEDWWRHVCAATKELLHTTGVNPQDIKSIGIAYQMHGLVLVDRDHEVLRPSIIWCDSRAVEIGDKAFDAIGHEQCLSTVLNSPGNFTASKLRWVQEQEPEIYERIHNIMLPGDYIAMKLTGEIVTTVSGLSEGVFWDFKNNELSSQVMDHYGIDHDLIPKIKNTLSIHGEVSASAAKECGLVAGIPVTYRAGDQPNNALSLGVFNPNEVAATGGTSGVVYGVVDRPAFDPKSRVNGFAHVNHTPKQPRIGILLCINGSGILYSWIKHNVALEGMDYNELEARASSIPVGSNDLCIIPFGNGAERILENKSPGAQIRNLHFNIHKREHMYRAALEGIAFSFNYGFQIMSELGLKTTSIKVGNDNLFQSRIFAQAVCDLIGCEIEVIQTTGAVGAAQASGVGSGIYSNLEEATSRRIVQEIISPSSNMDMYREAYEIWKMELDRMLKEIND